MVVSLRFKHCLENISAQAACHAATREYFCENKNEIFCDFSASEMGADFDLDM
jgi:hypothetical protein